MIAFHMQNHINQILEHYVLLIIYVPMLTLSPSVKGLWINGECSHGIKHALNFPYVASNVIKK